MVLAACAACGTGAADRGVTVYAASSLQPPLEARVSDLEEAARARIVFNFGSSSDLVRQIAAARKADLFLSADEEQMDRLERDGLVEPGTRHAILSNRLVVVAPAGSRLEVASAEELAAASIGRIALGDSGGVPVGRYAREWLEAAGVWERIADRVVPAPSARAVLAAVESGGVQAGIVYRSDASTSRRVAILYEVPEEEGPRITYWGAVVRGAAHAEEARRVLGLLKGPGAKGIFDPFGFGAPGRGADDFR